MARIASVSFVVTVNKLMRDDQQDAVLTADQQLMLVQAVPGVMEEILHDPHVMVEVTLLDT